MMNGEIERFGRKYPPEEPTLAAYVGESVTLRFDPRDMGEIRVFHDDGFLCRAVSAEFPEKRFRSVKSSAPATGAGAGCGRS